MKQNTYKTWKENNMKELRNEVKNILIAKNGGFNGYDWMELMKKGYNGTQIQNAYNYFRFSPQQRKFREEIGLN